MWLTILLRLKRPRPRLPSPLGHLFHFSFGIWSIFVFYLINVALSSCQTLCPVVGVNILISGHLHIVCNNWFAFASVLHFVHFHIFTSVVYLCSLMSHCVFEKKKKQTTKTLFKCEICSTSELLLLFDFIFEQVSDSHIFMMTLAFRNEFYPN